MVGATDWASCSAKTSGADLSGGCVTDAQRYVQYQVTLESSGASTPTFSDISIAFTPSDQSRPSINASSIAITGLTNGSWTNTEPTLTWTAGTDNTAVVGYCISLDEQVVDATPSAGLNPETSSGKLVGLDDGITNLSTCPYIVAGTTVNLSSISGLTLTSNKQYWFSIKAVDAAGNVANDSAGPWQDLVSFKYDGFKPTNPSYLSLPGDFISTKSATIIWPTSGGDAAADTGGSGLAGLQYRIGSSGTWYGDSHTGTQTITDLLTNDGNYATTQTYDYVNISEGSNLIYLRTWDTAGNISEETVSGALKVNTTSPSAPRNLAVSSSSSTTNSYSFTWDDPSSVTGQASKLTFCYTVNTVPSVTSCNYTTADANSLTADAYATQPGENTLYLVARDEAGNINYEAYASVPFTYSGSAPGSPLNIDLSDISIKSTSNWKLAASWDPPTDLGAGISTYKIYRSTTNTTCSASFSSFTYIGSTAGTSYADSGLTQQNYYYCVKACDSANSCGAASGTDTGFPDGKYTSAADLSSGPTVSSITTKKATITWSTSRTADSKVSYGTSSNSYNTEEPSNSSQVTSHTINLTNLSPGTTYYYKTKWTDEDGNTGTSEEKSFSTEAAPTSN